MVGNLAVALLACVAMVPSIQAVSMSTEMRTNPVRKVVTMLQQMQQKVEEEGEKADELYDKFMCYCKTSGGDLAAQIQATEAKVAELGPAIEAAKSKVDQLKKDLTVHKSDRKAAQSAMDEATAIREKERKAYEKESAEGKTNLNAVEKALTSLEDGAAGASFLQSSSAATLRDYLSKATYLSNDQQEVLSFLSGEEEGQYAPASGEVIGIVKQMGVDMDENIKDIHTKEKEANDAYNGLMAAKGKEFSALSKSIEEKQDRLGRIGIEIAEMKADVGDSGKSLEEDKLFLRDMDKNCKEKAGMHEEEKKMRAQEVVALAETIKILNDDDALELFKKTLPSAASSFLQLQTTSSIMRKRARKVISQARARAPAHRAAKLDFIELALTGRKVGFEKVIHLVDNLLTELKKEAKADEDKKTYCEEQLDVTEDKKKVLTQTISDLDTSISETREGISKVSDEITSLKEGIVDLDKAVAEATTQRKQENAEYKEIMQANGQAKELIVFAKKRLNKFYNPKAFVQTAQAPADEDASAEEAADSFLQLRASSRRAAPPPPETMEAYSKKSGESSSVIEMMDLLVKDLDKEMVTAEKEEEYAQEEYERTMKDSGEKRATDSKSLSDKEGAKADMKSSLEESRAEEKASSKEVMATDKYLIALHGECDFVMQYFDVRKQARADEIDALEKAKDVLSGADVSLVQRARTVRVQRLLHQA